MDDLYQSQTRNSANREDGGYIEARVIPRYQIIPEHQFLQESANDMISAQILATKDLQAWKTLLPFWCLYLETLDMWIDLRLIISTRLDWKENGIGITLQPPLFHTKPWRFFLLLRRVKRSRPNAAPQAWEMVVNSVTFESKNLTLLHQNVLCVCEKWPLSNPFLFLWSEYERLRYELSHRLCWL